MWVPVTLPEVVFLAEAPAGEPNLVDRVGVLGGWLRMAELRDAGEATFRRRVEQAREEVPAALWQGLAGAVRALGCARSGAAVSLRGAAGSLGIVVVAHAADVTLHLLVRADELAARWGTPEEMRVALVEELPLVAGCEGMHVVAWDEVLGERQLVWSGGRIVHGPPDPRSTAREASYAEAVAELARLVDPEPVRG